MAISLSERAIKEVRRIITEQNLPEATGLRVGVKGGGCSGFSYTLGFDDQERATDQISETEGVRVLCDEKKEEERAAIREKELVAERDAKRKANKEKQKARESRRKKAA